MRVATRSSARPAWTCAIPYYRCLAVLLLAACGGAAQTPDLSGDVRVEPRRALERAKPTADAKPARLDSFGDPLPDGALRRYGTIHLRHEGATSLSFSPDGKILVSAGDSRLRVWNVASGRLLRERKLAADGGLHVQFALGESPFGLPTSRVLVVVNGGHIGLWDPYSGREWPRSALGRASFGRLTETREEVINGKAVPTWSTSLGTFSALSPDGQTAVFAKRANGGRPTVLACDLATGAVWLTVAQPCAPDDDEGSAVSFSADGRRMAVLTADGSAEVWEPATRRLVTRLPAVAGYRRRNLVLAPDGRSLLITGNRGPTGGYYERRDVASGAPLPVPAASPLPEGPLLASPDGRSLVARQEDSLMLFDASTLRRRGTIPNLYRNQGGAAYSADGRLLATVNNAGAIHFWDPATAQRRNPLAAHVLQIADLGASPDGRLLATGGTTDPDVRVWDKATGRLVRTIHRASDDLAAVYYPRNDVLVLRGGNSLEAWNPNSGRRLGSAEGAFVTVATAPGGRYLTGVAVTSPDDGEGPVDASVWQFDLGRGTERLVRRFVQSNAFGISQLSPDGRRLARASAEIDVTGNGQMRLTLIVEDTATGRRILATPSGSFGAFSADGRLLVMVAPAKGETAPGMLQIWDVVAGRLLCEAPGVPSALLVYFTPDSRGVVLVREQDIAFHATAGGRKLAAWKSSSNCGCIDFAPGGDTLFTGHYDGTALAWDLSAYRPKKTPPGDLGRAWEALAGERGEALLAAVEQLADDPAAAAFLRTKVRPAVPLPAGAVAGWCAELAGRDFRAREAAHRQLRQQLDRAVPALEALQKSSPSAEARRRADALLADSEVVTSPALRRDIWAVAALERAGSAEAKALLRELAAGDPAARLTREAKESLDRLGK
ncbi:MAG: WD40 repeat domain-containing protein [Gemmataceae bacterium]